MIALSIKWSRAKNILRTSTSAAQGVGLEPPAATVNLGLKAKTLKISLKKTRKHWKPKLAKSSAIRPEIRCLVLVMPIHVQPIRCCKAFVQVANSNENITEASDWNKTDIRKLRYKNL